MNRNFRPFLKENALSIVFESAEENEGSISIASNSRKRKLSGGFHIEHFEEGYGSFKVLKRPCY